VGESVHHEIEREVVVGSEPPCRRGGVLPFEPGDDIVDVRVYPVLLARDGRVDRVGDVVHLRELFEVQHVPCGECEEQRPQYDGQRLRVGLEGRYDASESLGAEAHDPDRQERREHAAEEDVERPDHRSRFPGLSSLGLCRHARTLEPARSPRSRGIYVAPNAEEGAIELTDAPRPAPIPRAATGQAHLLLPDEEVHGQKRDDDQEQQRHGHGGP